MMHWSNFSIKNFSRGAWSYGLRAVIGAATVMAALIFGSFPASATTPAPVLSTFPAHAINTEGAVLSGDIDPRGTATNWYFQYGTTHDYGTDTPVLSVGAGNVAVGISSSISRLDPDTFYHFRLVATNEGGTVVGHDRTFMTAHTAPEVSTTATTNVTDSSAIIHGTVNPQGQATHAYFQYGTSSGYGSATSLVDVGSGQSTSNFAVSVNRLAENQTYHFRLVAIDATGTSTGSDASFTTSGVPSTYTGNAVGISTSGGRLTGTVVPNDHRTRWFFQYGTSANYGTDTQTRLIAASDKTRSVSSAIGGLAASTTIHFRLVAANGAGTTYGADNVFTTLGPTIFSSRASVTYGQSTMLTGTLPYNPANQVVAIFEQRVSQRSPVQLTSVVTAADGAWSLRVKPIIETNYFASWTNELSAPTTVAAQPAIQLRAGRNTSFVTTVKAARSLTGHYVVLQREGRAGWANIARRRLLRDSSTTFMPSLPRGRSRLRVVMSQSQVGPGYLASASHVIVFRS